MTSGCSRGSVRSIAMRRTCTAAAFRDGKAQTRSRGTGTAAALAVPLISANGSGRESSRPNFEKSPKWTPTDWRSRRSSPRSWPGLLGSMTVDRRNLRHEPNKRKRQALDQAGRRQPVLGRASIVAFRFDAFLSRRMPIVTS